MKSIDEGNGSLCGHAVLIVETDISAATNLQDALAETGARIWTAYTFDRAYRYADKSQLSGVIINTTLSPLEMKKLENILIERNVPFVVPNVNSENLAGDHSASHVFAVAQMVSLVRSSAGNIGMQCMANGNQDASKSSRHVDQSVRQ